MRNILHHLSWPVRILCALLVIGSIIRFWNYVPSVMFQGDQARDAQIVSDIITKGDLVFIGPVMSVGNIYLGPFYYYFMVPWLWLTYPSPLGPAVAVTLFSIAGIAMMYLLGKDLIGKTGALIAAVFFTFSSILIEYSRFSWNPNLAPMIMMIVVWAIYRALTFKPWYWLLAAVGFSILIQLHYITLMAAGGIGLLWLYQVWQLTSERASAARWRQLLLVSVLSIAIVIISLTPLFIFDLRHDGLNRKAFLSIFTETAVINPEYTDTIWEKIGAVLYDSEGRALSMGFNHFFGYYRWLGNASLLILAGATIWYVRKKTSTHRLGMLILSAFLLPILLGTSLYQHSLFTHYILFVLPLVFWWWGFWLAKLRSTWWGNFILVVTVVSFMVFNVTRYKLNPPDWNILEVKKATEQIVNQLGPDESYSLVMLGPSKDLYALNYRYFLNTTDRPPLPIERSGEADTLVVIDEEKTSKVADLPIYEIVIFPNKANPSTLSIPEGPVIYFFRR